MGRILSAAFTRTRDALRKAVIEETNRLWNETARAHYEEHLKGRYPLDRDAKAQDAEPAEFAKFFRPREGLFAMLHAQAVDLNGVVLDGQPLLKLSDDFLMARDIVGRFQAVLWHAGPEKPDGDEEISVRFTFQVFPPFGTISQILLKIDGDPFDFTKRILGGVTGKATVTWREGTDVSMTIMIGRDAGATECLPKRQKPGRHWGLFRLMDALNIEQKKANEYALSYEYRTNTFVKFALVCEDANNPFAPDFFSRFRFPERVAE